MRMKIRKKYFAAAALFMAAAVFLGGCAGNNDIKAAADTAGAAGSGAADEETPAAKTPGSNAADSENSSAEITEAETPETETLETETLETETPKTEITAADAADTETPASEPADTEPSSSSAVPDAPDTDDILICIDPGHYAGSYTMTGENIYGYTEGDFTLRLALRLRQILKEQYGIHSILTRETGSITLGGYTNGELDGGHISLRGEYARGCSYFISLHTNANEDNANGFPTCQQPASITKAIVIVNQPALQSETALRMAEAIGRNLSDINFRLGLSATDAFAGISSGDPVIEWTKEKNDQLNAEGFICQRLGSHGDYYGVLRGSANAGVPGMIVEHGFHTVAKMRRLAMEEDLCELWAGADARGIAEGLGIQAAAPSP